MYTSQVCTLLGHFEECIREKKASENISTKKGLE